MLTSIIRAVLMAVIGIVFVFSTFLAGYVVQQTTTPARTASTEATPQPAQTPTAKNSTEADFAVFWEAWGIIKSEFLGKVPDDKNMTYAAIKGMVDTLGDEHTHFDEPARAAILESDLNGNFEGIGATVETKNGQIVIVAPLKGRPAEKAGLQPGDIVVKIDGQSTDGMSLTDAISRIRGPKGTQVTLTIVRAGAPAPLDITITRATIETEAVSKRQLDNGLVYLQLAEFSAPSSKGRNRPSESSPNQPSGL